MQEWLLDLVGCWHIVDFDAGPPNIVQASICSNIKIRRCVWYVTQLHSVKKCRGGYIETKAEFKSRFDQSVSVLRWF